MKNWHQKLFIFVIVLLLALPMTYMLGVKDRTVLNGVEPITGLPSLQEKSWMGRTFQQDFEKWWASHFGFRKLALKTKNTLYDLANLNKIHAGYSGTLIETTNKNLIIKNQIDLLYHTPCMQIKETLAPKLRRLVKTLLADNRQVLFVLGSTKADVYESEIPERFKFFAHRKFDVYSYWEELLKELEIPYINTVPMMKDMAKKEGYEPFPRTGIHWSFYGSYRATEEILKKLSIAPPKIDKITKVDMPPFAERDLGNLINTFIPYLPHERFFNLTLMAPKRGLAKKMVLIGDSYTGFIMAVLTRNNYVDNANILQICNHLMKEEEVSAFFNKDVYLFVNQGVNWNDPHASMFQNIDTILKKMPTHFMHDWLKDGRGGFTSTDKSCIIIPNVNRSKLKLRFTASRVGGKLVVNGKEIAIDKQKFETILPGKDTDEKYRFLVTLKTEYPVTLSQITIQPASLLQHYNFSDKTLPFLVSGLSYAETGGRWSDGDTVRFRFDLPQDKPLRMDFQGTFALLCPNHPAVTAEVFANGVKLATWAFRYKGAVPKTELIVPLNVLKIKKPLDIEIKIDGAVAPIDLGKGKDKRRLGMAIRSLSISTAQ